MSVINQNLLLTPEGYQISRSVRLRSSASAYFNRTPSSSGSSTTWTWSGWVKRGVLGVGGGVFYAGVFSTSNDNTGLQFRSDDALQIFQNNGATTVLNKITTQVFRDLSAWYHIVLTFDTTNATAEDRVRIYVNGVRVTAFSTNTNISQNGTTYANSTSYGNRIFRDYTTTYLDGYLTEVNFIDGQALTPSSFGETDTITGVWKPKKYAGTYGTNGFYLNFSDNSSRMALGHSETGTHVDIVESDGSNQSIQAGVGACRVSTISTANASYTSAVNEYLVVTPSAAIPVTSSLKIYFDINYAWANGRNLYINGTQVSSGNVTVATVSGMQEWTINFTGHGITSLSSITTPVNTGGRAVFYGISIDGNTVYATANDWTPNNISLTAGATYDSMLDTPTPYADGGNGRGNYCVINPLTGASTAAVADGNLGVGMNGSEGRKGTIAVTSGKWYWECSFTVGVIDASIVGIANPQDPNIFVISATGYGYYSNANKVNNNTAVAYGAAWGVSDTIGVALDLDAGTLTFYKNGTSQGTAYTGLSGLFCPAFATNASGSTNFRPNFGQRPFAYTPPTGFKALNTQNLPDSTIKKGNAYFDVSLFTGTGSAQTITNSGAMQPDLVWLKRRSTAATHVLVDSVRGVSAVLNSNLTNAESTASAGTGLTAFNSNGFSLGTENSATGSTNVSTETYAAWQWKESASAGFDIVTYTGTGASQNVSHSLGVAPKMMITKKRSTTGNWSVYHANLTSYTYSVYLNSTNAQASDPNTRGSAPSSSTFNVGTDTDVNANGATYVAYLFAEVAGFSKFGSYTGNGSTDGPFVYCGFRPRFIMVKGSSNASSWQMFDTSRSTYNVVDNTLWADLSSAEGTGTARVDLLSNGFKVRAAAGTDPNVSGATYIYIAFAENPFKNSLAR